MSIGFWQTLRRGCCRNWALTRERKTIITKWKLHFVFRNRTKWKLAIQFKEPGSRALRLCIGFCITRKYLSVQTRCQALRHSVVVQIDQNRKRLWRAQRWPWVTCERSGAVGAGPAFQEGRAPWGGGDWISPVLNVNSGACRSKAGSPVDFCNSWTASCKRQTT